MNNELFNLPTIFSSAAGLQAAELIVSVTYVSVCLCGCVLSNFFFNSPLLQFFSDFHETWDTWSMCQYAKKTVQQIFKICGNFFLNFDLVSETAAVQQSRPIGLQFWSYSRSQMSCYHDCLSSSGATADERQAQMHW